MIWLIELLAAYGLSRLCSRKTPDEPTVIVLTPNIEITVLPSPDSAGNAKAVSGVPATTSTTTPKLRRIMR